MHNINEEYSCTCKCQRGGHQVSEGWTSSIRGVDIKCQKVDTKCLRDGHQMPEGGHQVPEGWTPSARGVDIKCQKVDTKCQRVDTKCQRG